MQKKRNRVRAHKTKESAIRAVNHVKWFHHKSFDPFRDDEDVVLAAVQREKENFKFASDRLKGSKDFVLKLIQSHIRCIDYAHPEVKEDREVVIALIALYWISAKKLSEAQRDAGVFKVCAASSSLMSSVQMPSICLMSESMS